MGVKKIDLKPFKEAVVDASYDAALAMTDDIEEQEYTPFLTGRTQKSMKAKKLKNKAYVSNSTPYIHIYKRSVDAFSTRYNSRARGQWWAVYLAGGEREHVPFEAFAESLEERLKE